MDGGSGSETWGRSQDVSLVLDPQFAQVPPIPIATTIEFLFKWVRKEDGPSTEPPQISL